MTTTPRVRTHEGRWADAARAAGLIRDGEVRPTIFAEISALAARTGAVNLGQGFPDTDGPPHVVAAAVEALRAGRNQYPPGDGVPELREAIAAHAARHYGLDVDPGTDVLVTTGATEAIAATVLALAGPGDEVVALEPLYDAYAATVAMAGARLVPVPLVASPDGFVLDTDAFRAAVGPATRLVLLNSPHNPTGAVLSPAELAVVAECARRHDVVVVTDEVYEHLTFDGRAHVPIATLPGMSERTLRISSAGKTLSLTGWKVGWVTGPAELVTAVRAVKQFLTYVSGAPLQPAVALALADPDGATGRWVAELATSLADRRDLLVAGLRDVGFDVVVPHGTYFVLADAAPLGRADGAALCRAMPDEVGVAAVPVSALCAPGSPTATRLGSWVRFAFCKREPVLVEALDRLAALRP